MTKGMRGLWLTAAVATLFAMGCGETGGTDGGTSCTSDANCGTGKVCHPILKECITSCNVAADCSEQAQKKCAHYDGTDATMTSPGFCQCTTDALCNSSTTGQICSTATLRCANKCTSNSDCPSNFTCDTTSGQCNGGNSDAGTDGGMDAGTDAGVTCDSMAAQPDTCGYGNVCTLSNTCEAITDDTSCSNIANSGRPAWTSASTGPVIFNVVDEADDQTKCTGTDNAFTVTVYAYAAAGQTFPAMKSNLPGFFYYTSSGNAVDIPTNLLQQANYTLYGTTVMGAKFTLCSTATSSIVAGFGFTNGNGVCKTLTR